MTEKERSQISDILKRIGNLIFELNEVGDIKTAWELERICILMQEAIGSGESGRSMT